MIRFRETVGDLYDRRVATEMKYRLTDRVSAVGAYVFRNQEKGGIAVDENRLVAGVTYALTQGALAVKGSTYYERHLVETESHFNRFRQRFEITQRNKTISPWVYQDFTFRQDRGFIRSRSRVGFQWRQHSGYALKVAYQFESISKGSAWAPRHVLYTELSIDKPFWIRE